MTAEGCQTDGFMKLTDTIENLPRLQKPQLAALKKLGILTVRDLLLYFPYRYLDFSKVVNIKAIRPGESVSLKVQIKSIGSRFSFKGRMSLAEAIVSDETGSLKVVWFNQPYLAQSLKTGDEIFLAGQPDYYNFSLQLTNPIYEKAADFPVHTSRLVPLYHLKQGLYPKTFRNLVANILPLAGEVTDELPAAVIKNQGLMDISQTIRQSHFPESEQVLAAAKKRLAFEEIFLSQLAAQRHKMELARKKSHIVKFDQVLVKKFVDSLPFKLTVEQKKAAWDILRDLEKPVPMNRLLQGDVGSGKTVVALIASLEAASQNLQAVFLAPTEILARQHFEVAKKLLPGSQGRQNLKIILLTQNYNQIGDESLSKDKLQMLISQGMPGIYIGTHALLQKNIKFKNPALVIIDEQHRFGVEQRAALMQNAKIVPHLLSLSATPIPRTLQLAFFGELEISQIKTKPVGRKPILTKLVLAQNRGQAYEFVKKQLLLGRQAFVITPLVEQSAVLETKSAKKELESLKKIFPRFNIGLLHGRMKSKEKESVMADFLANKINILVSTSVVEVGVDIPNASVMLIEGADRFGLSQLHQFRGRVGRAEHQSFCFLFTDNQNPDTINRLTSFTKIQDGFALAEADLKTRGFGEIYGQAQAGWNFKYFDPSYTALIEPARQEAVKLLKDDLNLQKYPLLQDKIKDKVVHFE